MAVRGETYEFREIKDLANKHQWLPLGLRLLESTDVPGGPQAPIQPE